MDSRDQGMGGRDHCFKGLFAHTLPRCALTGEKLRHTVPTYNVVASGINPRGEFSPSEPRKLLEVKAVVINEGHAKTTTDSIIFLPGTP